ncbi:MAG: TRAP transporter small permease subunit [Pseudomonadota bacterium]
MLDALTWLFGNMFGGIMNLFRAIADPMSWLNWADPQALIRFIYYGGSTEFFFVVFDLFLIFLIIGLIRRQVLWGVVRGIEFTHNVLGRFFAWAGLLMVLQQVVIVFLQRIFRVSEISIGPFGYIFTRDLSWYAEELKLYNAMIVALCCAYTFVQGGHVRVDLVYAGVSRRAKNVIDMVGSLLFILPTMTLIWMFGWYFLWRHLVTPKISASDRLELLERKARLLKWNVETIGFSPNGFDAYFLFKILLVAFAGTMFLQGIAFFYRNLLEYIEGPESEGKYHDKDDLGDDLADKVADIH